MRLRRSIDAAALLTVAAWLGCSAPERDDGIDRMVFADDEALEDGVADSALEPIPRIRVPLRPKARTGGIARPQLSDFALPAPRCANQADRNGPSRSLGQVTSGSLHSPCRIAQNGAGYVSTNKNGFATDETVALLQWAAAQMAAQFPGSPPLVIGALSKQDGGHYPPHKSHQSGRDADIGYPRTERTAPRQFLPTTSATLDAERLWTVLEALLASGKLGFVFMDYELQAALYQGLLDVGYSEAQLQPVFQYPAGPGVPTGLVRHASGHADHFHVRFRCPDSDKPDCVE